MQNIKKHIYFLISFVQTILPERVHYCTMQMDCDKIKTKYNLPVGIKISRFVSYSFINPFSHGLFFQPSRRQVAGIQVACKLGRLSLIPRL
jgi:hypothetical protein